MWHTLDEPAQAKEWPEESVDRMRRSLIRSVLSVLALAILLLAWLVAGPWWARALDAVHTTRVATVTSLSVREYSGFFHFFPGRDGAPLSEAEGFTWYD